VVPQGSLNGHQSGQECLMRLKIAPVPGRGTICLPGVSNFVVVNVVPVSWARAELKKLGEQRFAILCCRPTRWREPCLTHPRRKSQHPSHLHRIIRGETLRCPPNLGSGTQEVRSRITASLRLLRTPVKWAEFTGLQKKPRTSVNPVQGPPRCFETLGVVSASGPCSDATPTCNSVQLL